MPSLTRESRLALVRSLSLNVGQAEVSEPRIIFPVPEHARALEPDVVLIVGDRGAGKTQLVRALENEEVRTALTRQISGLRIPPGTVEWRTGWPLATQGPDSSSWRNFAAHRTRDDVVGAWLAYLVRVLANDLDASAQASLDELFQSPGVDVERALDVSRRKGVATTAALDSLDQRLLDEGRWIFVAYDELDTLVLDDWSALGVLVRGVVSLWAAYARRWKRIRPKVFLRSDFYKHHREIAGADVAKLAANRVELQWSDKNLYGALIKHILNKRDGDGEEQLFEHFSSVVPTHSDITLGHIPKLSVVKEAKPFIDRLVSEYMGANKKKGFTFTWLLDHLRDGNGRALPRTLVWLIELAADIEHNQPRATGSHLLSHVSVRVALDRVSELYVQQAQTNELFWLAGLGDRLQRDREVPWSRRELLKLLGHEFDASWGAPSTDIRPPGQSPDEVLDSLLELGVLRGRPDNSFDVPDIYLEGLGLKRRGGVAKE
jgi:hypothetical protein